MCEDGGAGLSHGAEPQVPPHVPQQDTGDVSGRWGANNLGAGGSAAGLLFVVVQQSGEAAGVFTLTLVGFGPTKDSTWFFRPLIFFFFFFGICFWFSETRVLSFLVLTLFLSMFCIISGERWL